MRTRVIIVTAVLLGVGVTGECALPASAVSLSSVGRGTANGYIVSQSHYSYYPLEFFAILSGTFPMKDGQTGSLSGSFDTTIRLVNGLLPESSRLYGANFVGVVNGKYFYDWCAGPGGSGVSSSGGYTVLPTADGYAWPLGGVVTALCSGPVTGPVELRIAMITPPLLIPLNNPEPYIYGDSVGGFVATRIT